MKKIIFAIGVFALSTNPSSADLSTLFPTDREVKAFQLVFKKFSSDDNSIRSLKAYVVGGCLSSRLSMEEAVKVKIYVDDNLYKDAVALVKSKIKKCLAELKLIDGSFDDFTVGMATTMAYVRGIAINNFFRGTLEYSLRRELGLQK